MSDLKFHPVAPVAEVPDGEGRVFEVEGRMIAVFREGDTFSALDDACPHAGAPLSDGFVEGGAVTCTWHGWRFSLQDGRHLEGSKCKVATYPTRVEGGQILVAVP